MQDSNTYPFTSVVDLSPAIYPQKHIPLCTLSGIRFLGVNNLLQS